MAMDEVRMPFLAQQGKYRPVDDDAEEGEESVNVTHHQFLSQQRRKRWMIILAYVAQSIVMFVLGVVAAKFYGSHGPSQALGTYETGFATESVVCEWSSMSACGSEC